MNEIPFNEMTENVCPGLYSVRVESLYRRKLSLYQKDFLTSFSFQIIQDDIHKLIGLSDEEMCLDLSLFKNLESLEVLARM